MANTLVGPNDLIDLPGAPYDDALVDMAAASVRAEAGWHIAPVQAETLTVDSYGGYLLILPSRRVVSVTAVRDVTTGSEVLTGWSRMSGGLYRRTGWPAGVLEVDLTHGYDTTPLDLLPILAARTTSVMDPRDMSVASYSVNRGPFGESKTYREGASGMDPVIARYAVPAGVA